MVVKTIFPIEITKIYKRKRKRKSKYCANPITFVTDDCKQFPHPNDLLDKQNDDEEEFFLLLNLTVI